MFQKYYQKLIGSALWLNQMTRPDISTAISILASATSDPRQIHLDHLYHLYGYLLATKDYVLTIATNNDPNLYGFSDSDYAGDTSDYDSRYGYAIFYYGTLISFKSQKTKLIPDLSTYAEYIALHYTINQVHFIQKLVDELTCQPIKPILLSDNLSTIAIVKSSGQTFKSKHFATKFHRTKMLLLQNQIELQHVLTARNLADTFTKPLSKIPFFTLTKTLLNSTNFVFTPSTHQIPFSSKRAKSFNGSESKQTTKSNTQLTKSTLLAQYALIGCGEESDMQTCKA